MPRNRGAVIDRPYSLGRATVGALYGAVKKCAKVSEWRIPLLAPQQGGVAERSRKI